MTKTASELKIGNASPGRFTVTGGRCAGKVAVLDSYGDTGENAYNRYQIGNRLVSVLDKHVKPYKAEHELSL